MIPYDIRLIAMDMDGTLLNSKQEISAENLSALKDAQKAGIAIAICSGRLPGDSGRFMLEAGLKECAILSLNGAYCIEKPLGKAYANHCLTPLSLEHSLTLLGQQQTCFGCFLQNRIVIIDPLEQLDDSAWASRMHGEGAPMIAHGMEALNQRRDEGVNKIVYYESEPEKLRSMRVCLEAIDGIEVTSSWAQNLEIMPKGVNKGGAVREMAERLGLNASQVMTFGDYDNDESMIAYAGLGVAMGNAMESVKRVAKHVTLTNDENGVAVCIRRFALS
ncbi:MAG: Cof-type HAD-IIB family hydrolase [Clostridia bacterium]